MRRGKQPPDAYLSRRTEQSLSSAQRPNLLAFPYGRVCKPGSVPESSRGMPRQHSGGDHLSTHARCRAALAAHPGGRRAASTLPYSALLQVGFTKPPPHDGAGGLLHHRFSFPTLRGCWVLGFGCWPARSQLILPYGRSICEPTWRNPRHPVPQMLRPYSRTAVTGNPTPDT